ncbi:GntR family transcriptional regulator [Corynebacterium sp. FDAARGOS 1242]|uniref:GntR family transcriptional regulator n=1 Tax=Corynebacterium sp. FDAARGOS 1242 TaxID=2778078 RepID=UPI00194E9A35|nr:GntR family transcriptional regulator [Corynebacterium sp. FDAARGOS 1242]QRP97197.1 GntR family transcriptional regulator [Corynebacterium sp. FDAARGOS 1242]
MLADSVAAALRAAISEGEYMPGQQLNEVRASERFDCSRNTLRESFAMLAAERIVERIPHRGVFIATPDEDFVRDLYLARAAIEPAAARYATFPDPGELVRLTESAVLSDAPLPLLNQRFHQQLVAGLGSSTLERTMSHLLARMRLTFLLTLERYPQIHDNHVQPNIELAHLIARGERDAAADACRADLMRAMDSILRVL